MRQYIALRDSTFTGVYSPTFHFLLEPKLYILGPLSHGYPSGQREQTHNLPAQAYTGSSPVPWILQFNINN